MGECMVGKADKLRDIEEDIRANHEMCGRDVLLVQELDECACRRQRSCENVVVSLETSAAA